MGKEEKRRSELLRLLNKAGRNEAEDRELFVFLTSCAAARRGFYLYLADADWEDVVADAVEEMLRKCDGSKRMSSLISYFHRKLYQKAVDHWRKLPKGNAAWDEVDGSVDPSPASRHERDFANSELLGKAIRRLREEVGERYVRVLFLRQVQGCSSREVATMLCLTPGNVDKILSRARIAMKQFLLELGGGE